MASGTRFSRTLCALLLVGGASGCDGQHCYTPGHCFSTTYALDTGPRPWDTGSPRGTTWWLRDVVFDDGAPLTGYFHHDGDSETSRDWAICAGSTNTSLPPYEGTFLYTPESSFETPGMDAIVAFHTADLRSLRLDDGHGFDIDGDLGEIRALEVGVECMNCDDIRRFSGYVEAVDDVPVGEAPGCP